MPRIVKVALLATLLAGLLPAMRDVAAAPLQVPDTLAQRALACTGCHGPQGRSTPSGYIPRIAGKPAGYLAAQLRAFRDGARRHDPMARLLVHLGDDYLAELAGHFAAQKVAYPAPTPAQGTAGSRELGERLVRHGDPARRLPACVGCHGGAMTGVEPATPGLLGLPRDYLVAQLGAWRIKVRHATAPDCMAEIAQRMQPQDITAVADWLASRRVPADAGAVASVPLPRPLPLPMACGSTAP